MTLEEAVNEQEEKYVITPWGCLSTTLQDYAVDISHITPAMGKHMVEDFMDAMAKAGHVRKMEDGERK